MNERMNRKMIVKTKIIRIMLAFKLNNDTLISKIFLATTKFFYIREIQFSHKIVVLRLRTFVQILFSMGYYNEEHF